MRILPPQLEILILDYIRCQFSLSQMTLIRCTEPFYAEAVFLSASIYSSCVQDSHTCTQQTFSHPCKLERNPLCIQEQSHLSMRLFVNVFESLVDCKNRIILHVPSGVQLLVTASVQIWDLSTATQWKPHLTKWKKEQRRKIKDMMRPNLRQQRSKRVRAHVLHSHYDPVIFTHFYPCVCVCAFVWVSQSRSKEPLGGLSREAAEIEVGNSHQKCPNLERCRQEPHC